MARRAFWGVLVMVLLSLTGCDAEHVVYSSFKQLPEDGWQRKMALHYTCETTDSVQRADVTVSVRHDASYAYRTLELVVDMISETGKVERRNVSIPVTDEYGNWTGSGFGALYHTEAKVARDISPEASLKVVVWQAMCEGDTLKGISEIGVKITESGREK